MQQSRPDHYQQANSEQQVQPYRPMLKKMRAMTATRNGRIIHDRSRQRQDLDFNCSAEEAVRKMKE